MTEQLLDSLDPERTYIIKTEIDGMNMNFLLHLSKGQFYTRKQSSKDPKYCLVTKLNNKKNYKESELDLGITFDYIHPKLNKEVNSGAITSIELR
jgi:hypothetical protein